MTYGLLSKGSIPRGELWCQVLICDNVIGGDLTLISYPEKTSNKRGQWTSPLPRGPVIAG